MTANLFYRQSSSRDGLTSDCKPCRNKRVKDFRERKAEEISARRRNAYNANPRKFIERTLEWQKENPDKMLIKARRWARTEHGRKSKVANRQRRIALLANALTPESLLVTAEWFASVVERQGGKCLYCGTVCQLEMEHVEPLSRGGLHVCENIVGACTSCNGSKGAKFLLEWRMR
jgi:5-methylcytosine-specific restriction endonuclease McrA